MTKHLIRIGVAVLTTLLILVVLWQFRIVGVYVLVSLVLAATLRPLATHLVGKSLVMRAAWIFLFLLMLAGFGYLLFSTGEIAIHEIQFLAKNVSAQDEWLLPVWLKGSPYQQSLLARLPPPTMLFESITGDQGQLILPVLFGFTQGFGEIISAVFVILFLSIYWSINQNHFERLWLSLLPSDQRKQARGVWRTIELELGEYIRNELIQCFLAALILGFGYWLLGSPYPVLLALISAIAWLIPVVGAPLTLVAPFFLGLFTSVQLGLITTVYTLIILIVAQVWIEPRFFKRTWDNPILTLTILLAMADVFGLIGIMAAPPVSTICQILWKLLWNKSSVSEAAIELPNLKERLERVWNDVRAMDEPPVALVTSSMERLTRLFEKAETVLAADPAADAGK